MPVLDFRGREEIYSHHLGTSFCPLVVDPKKSLLPSKKEQPFRSALDNNLIIHGDNLYALKALMPRYAGRVKCIYIDPPYNTGNEKWVFNDNVNSPMIKEWLGKAVDIEDLQRHDKWLCMMWPRLQLMKDLLAEDGVLICAIDHNEQEHLGLLLKEIFQDQEIVCVTVVHNPRGIQGDNFSWTHDYAYFVLPDKKGAIGQKQFEKNNINWRNLRNDGGESLRGDAKNCFYPIIVKDNNIIGFGDVLSEDKHPKSRTIKRKDGSYEIWPIDKNGIERKWRYARQSVESIKHLLKAKQKTNGQEFEIETENTENQKIENLSNFRNWGGESLRGDAKNCFYPIIVKDNNIIGFGDVLSEDKHPKSRTIKRKDGSYEIWPIDKNGIERKWRYARQSVESIKHLLKAKQKNGLNFEVEIGKDFGFYRTVWTGHQYDANEYGTKLLKSIMPNCPFNYPKSLFTVKECLKAVCAKDKNAIILDSFAGSGTTAHAVLDLNKEDGGNRKFILIECEDYAHSITAERVHRVIKGYEQTKEHKTVLWDKKLNIHTLENIKNQNKKDILDECLSLQKKYKENFDEIIKEYKQDRLQLIGIKKHKQKTEKLKDYFTYCSLGQAVDEESLLKGKSLPDYQTLASYVFYTATGKTLDNIKENENFYVGQVEKRTAIFVVYKPYVPFLRSHDSALHETRKEQIQKIMLQKDLNKAIVFATNCFYDEQKLSQAGITFCQLPFAIYKMAGEKT